MTRIWNCLFAYNRADRCADQGGVGALRIDGDAEIINCTFADNEGLRHPLAPSQPAHGGIYVISGEVDISNCILWGNTGDQLAFAGSSNDLTVEFTNIEGGWAGQGNINVEPLFMNVGNPMATKYQLTSLSPSREAGNTDLLPCDVYDLAPEVTDEQYPFSEACAVHPEELGPQHPFDLDRTTRLKPCKENVDQGAYEHRLGDRCPDIDGSGFVNILDIAAMLDEWGQPLDVCECDPDLDRDGVVDVNDLVILMASWGEFDCQSMTGGGAQVPQSIQDCYDMYFDPQDPSKYQACLDMLQRLEQ